MDKKILRKEFFSEGAVLVKSCLKKEDFFKIENRLCNEIRIHIACKNPFDFEWIEYAKKNPSTVSSIYDNVADLFECIELVRNSSIKEVIRALIDGQVKIYQKIPFRIDVPNVTKELAVWHQDDFYVRGAPNEITAWIPLQDTPMHVGALSVIKKSHTHGKIPHKIVWGKKYMPSGGGEGLFDMPVSIIEMKKGDVLFFNSYLLHSGNINFSERIRYSLQIRFTSDNLGKPSTKMGKLYEV